MYVYIYIYIYTYIYIYIYICLLTEPGKYLITPPKSRLHTE